MQDPGKGLDCVRGKFQDRQAVAGATRDLVLFACLLHSLAATLEARRAYRATGGAPVRELNRPEADAQDERGIVCGQLSHDLCPAAREHAFERARLAFASI